ncbi:MAG TPA: DUF4465 domain-containing protein [Bacteroidaceae bacterium]|jgi:hypothetical protein|nr:DUF4465 domain-containing protein [Bacteroidaceae bacterium]HOD69223.1 DUF4465 domain-containing protein [Bacteroidaceae bacterium]HQL26723.1 DUF4465 domain-containing protein [Bacteroidaceae bacterium]
MKKIYSIALVALTMGFVFVSCDNEKEEPIKSYTLSVSLEKSDSVYLGTDTANISGYYFRDDFSVDPFVLTHSFGKWGFGEGFTISSCADNTTPGYTNLSAVTRKGVKSNAYFIANTGGAAYSGGLLAEISFKDGKAYNAKECYVTNSTYAYLVIKNHDDGMGSHGIKQWTQSDSFTLTITGYNDRTKTGTVDFKLADGMKIVDNWEHVDLSTLGKVTRITFVLSSTDNGDWGMNTPSYFCLDQLTVTE